MIALLLFTAVIYLILALLPPLVVIFLVSVGVLYIIGTSEEKKR
jgi:hypothetical protein